MDLKLPAATPSEAERAAIEAVIEALGGARRDVLLPALHAANDRIGWISPGALRHICERLHVAPADAYGVATFYGMFSLEPRPATVAHRCIDLACAMAGPPTEFPGAHVIDSPCLGLCERAPAVLVSTAGDPPTHEVRAPAPSPLPQAGDPALVLLARAGRADPTSLAGYRRLGGYSALRRATALGPAGVIREVTEAGLVGRGGAAFPTGRKWDAVARHPVRPHHLVCNADESEPGTFKDRILMEQDPFALIEAMTIAGYATACDHAHVYLRGEYPLAHERLSHAIDECRTHGLLGPDVMGLGFAFDLEIRRGAGAYICGEETALFNSIEGFRGEPRNKPPFPVDAGLFGRPTVVNNVETLVNVLPIIERGGLDYAAGGTAGSKGTKLFCLSGHIVKPGLYEVGFGVTLRELLDLAGGVPGPASLQAVLLGGAAGTFVGPEDLDVALTFEGTRAIGASLGSGVVMVFDDSVALPQVLTRLAAFFRDESCGQCVPCRVGTVRQEEVLERAVAKGRLDATDSALLADIAAVMKDASICGLGQTAASAIESAIDRLGVLR